MADAPRWITACVPAFRVRKYVRASVESLLHQSYPWVRVVVVNDGDSHAPWESLADIADPRLLRFDVKVNRGPYFATAVVLEATPDDFLLIQDADDLSAPRRVELLFELLQREKSNYACSTLAQFHQDREGRLHTDAPLYSSGPPREPMSELASRIPHHGLFRTDALRQLGGYYGGFRFGYDELLTGLLQLAGPVSWSPAQLYWRRLRPDSLTRAPETGMRSARRNAMRADMRQLYRHAYAEHCRFRAGQIDHGQLMHALRACALARLDQRDATAISRLGEELREAMRAQVRHFSPPAHRWQVQPASTSRPPISALEARLWSALNPNLEGIARAFMEAIA